MVAFAFEGFLKMKKTTMICFALTMIIVGCKKVTVDFTYSPTEPRAGETIKFSNNSSAGESWAWSFGDNSTSMSKHPSKVFKKPGRYLVTLMVDSSKHQMHSKWIEVYDTVPTFVASQDTIYDYHDVELRAHIYNPFSHTLRYEWHLPDNCILQEGDVNDAKVVVYFTNNGYAKVGLTIYDEDVCYDIPEKNFDIIATKAPAIVMRKDDGVAMRQRMIDERLSLLVKATEEDMAILSQTNDTLVHFNGQSFYASQMSTFLEDFADMQILRIQIDEMAQKWYITTDVGLYVANFDGTSKMLIDAAATGAVYVDIDRNRMYWASHDGVYAMPLVKSKNNHFTTVPLQYNNLSNVDKITVNNIPL